MHRILFTAALLAVAPACVHAQAVPVRADAQPASQATARQSHNPFGAAMIELTRAAREQAATAKAGNAPQTAPRAQGPAPKQAPATDAPTLADSNRS